MQVDHVAPRYFPAISGSEFYIQEISEKLHRLKFKVKVLCSNALDFHAFGSSKGKFIKSGYSKINHINVFRYPIKYIPGISLFFNNSYSYYKKILRKLNSIRIFPSNYLNLLSNGPFTPGLLLQLIRDQIDIIHSVCMPFANNLFSLLAGRIKKIPTVCTPFYHYMNPRYQDSTYTRFLNKFHRVLTCSNKESYYLMKNGVDRSKIRRIHMGIDFNQFLRGDAKKFYEQFNLSDDKKVILFCGYKNFEKGAITLLHAIKNIVKHIPNCVFVFIGPSTIAFNITKRKLGPLRKHIINLGVVPYYSRVKLNAFAAHDLYVMPSRSDAYGIAFLEAWAYKKPVIGANTGATPEIIQNKKDGLLVPFHAPLELAKAAIYLLRHEKEAQQLGETGYQKVQNLTWDRVASQVYQIYQELIQN